MYELYDYGQMIAFPERVARFAEALERSRPAGAVVLDIGTGFGYFAILAAKLGARRVYAIEPNDAIRMGPLLAADNGVADRIEFLQGFSTEIELPEKADIVISDLRASMPFHGAHLRSIADARSRLLAPGGTLIPARDTLYCGIVQHAGLHQNAIEPWRGAISPAIDLGRVSDGLASRSSRCHLRPENLLPGIQKLAVLDYASIGDHDLEISHSWRIEHGGQGFGYCLFFDSELAPGIALRGAPGNPKLPYGHFFLPWRRPLRLEAGSFITLRLEARRADGDYAWSWDASLSAVDPRRELAFAK